MSMLGMSSLIAKRGPQRVQIRVSPSRRNGALPIGQTSRANSSSLTIDGSLRISRGEDRRRAGAAIGRAPRVLCSEGRVGWKAIPTRGEGRRRRTEGRMRHVELRRVVITGLGVVSPNAVGREAY